MKKNMFLVIALMTIISCGMMGKQAEAAASGSYSELLSSTLRKCEASEDPNRYMETVAELKRLEALFPGESWLTDYYLALYEVQMSVGKKDNQSVLKEAKDRIAKLKADKRADLSEVYTLEGYYYYALISTNPEENGKTYYKSVVDAYNRALAVKPDNPRANMLLTVFKLNMSKALGTKVKAEELPATLQKMETALKSEDKSSVNPHWGDNTLENLKNALKKYL